MSRGRKGPDFSAIADRAAQPAAEVNAFANRTGRDRVQGTVKVLPEDYAELQAAITAARMGTDGGRPVKGLTFQSVAETLLSLYIADANLRAIVHDKIRG